MRAMGWYMGLHRRLLRAYDDIPGIYRMTGSQLLNDHSLITDDHSKVTELPHLIYRINVSHVNTEGGGGSPPHLAGAIAEYDIK